MTMCTKTSVKLCETLTSNDTVIFDQKKKESYVFLL